MANSNLESILVETPGNFHDLETTSVLPKNISVFLRGGHLRDKIQLRGSSLQLEKNIHYEGFLAALVGSKQSTPCNYCSANDGPWAVCIAGRDADGDPLEGACAGCHYDGRGLECSFRGQFISRLSWIIWQVPCQYLDFFLRDGSEQASPSFRCSSRGQGSQNGEVSCQTSIQLPSSQNLQSLSPSQQNSTKAIAIANRQEAKRKAARTQRGNIDFKKELSKGRVLQLLLTNNKF